MSRNILIPAAALLILLAGCRKQEISTYKMGSSAVNFGTVSVSSANKQGSFNGAKTFSLSVKGMAEDTKLFEIPVALTGLVADRDREISVIAAPDSQDAAREGEHFTIEKAVMEAGQMNGYVTLRINRLPEGTSSLSTTLELQPNGDFLRGFPGYQRARIVWSEEYTRPVQAVWQYWYLFFSSYYSKKFHEIVVMVLGEEAEKYTNNKSYANANPELTYKLPTWWYGANNMLREAVRAHDTAHPDAPYRHSADVQRYPNYTTAVGSGTPADPIPTIYETLNAF